MTAITNQPASHAADNSQHPIGPLGEITEFFRQFILAAFHPYRPEQHYMRGPGPACQAKHDPISHRHLI